MKRPHPLRNQRGQSLIEALSLMMGLLLGLALVGCVLYFSLVHAMLSYLLHENLVCELSRGSADCDQILRTQAAPVLFAGKIVRIEKSTGLGRVGKKVFLRMPFQQTLVVSKSLRRDS